MLGVYHQTQRGTIPLEKARAYARWIAERYRGAPHVIWTAYPKATDEYVPILRELAAGLREGDGGARAPVSHEAQTPWTCRKVCRSEDVRCCGAIWAGGNHANMPPSLSEA